jgi:hypothetical protein
MKLISKTFCKLRRWISVYITYELYVKLNVFLRTIFLRIEWLQIIFRTCNRILENTQIQVRGCQFIVIKMINEERKLTSFQMQEYCI